MPKNVIIGSIVVIVSLGFMIYIVFWSRKTIENIRRKKLRSAREIIKRMNERR
jgi:uncharacterized Rossmann fold enzyme